MTAVLPTINTELTPEPSPRVVENDQYHAFVRRVLRSYGRRIGQQGDVEALHSLVTLATDLDYALQTAVTGLRAFGYSWAEIATRLGITRQAAQQRWGGDRP